MTTAGTRLCLCTDFTASRVPSAKASNIFMGKGFVVHMVSENWRQVPVSEKLLQISKDLVDSHVHCNVLSLSLVRAVLF